MDCPNAIRLSEKTRAFRPVCQHVHLEIVYSTLFGMGDVRKIHSIKIRQQW